MPAAAIRFNAERRVIREVVMVLAPFPGFGLMRKGGDRLILMGCESGSRTALEGVKINAARIERFAPHVCFRFIRAEGAPPLLRTDAEGHPAETTSAAAGSSSGSFTICRKCALFFVASKTASFSSAATFWL